MKLLKLSALSAAVLGSTVAMAAPTTTTQGYQYDQNRGIISNTAGAVTGTAETLFDTATHPAAVSAEIGTLGYGANIAWGVNENTELQAGWSGMNFDDETEFNSNDSWINYEKALGDGYKDFKGELKYDVDFSNPYLGVQMRPFANNFTVGTGVMVPRNKLKADISSKASTGGVSRITIDNQAYDLADGTTVQMKAENKNKLAPYLTVGYRPNINQNWGGFVEAGAAYMGKPEADVQVIRGAGVVNGPTNAQFERAAEKNIQKEDYLEWYPIVKAGLTYRF